MKHGNGVEDKTMETGIDSAVKTGETSSLGIACNRQTLFGKLETKDDCNTMNGPR